MNTTELRAKLIEMSEALSDAPESNMSLSIVAHRVESREELYGWVRLMSDPSPSGNGEYRWVWGEIAGHQVTVHYKPGLLGEQVIVGEPDLAGLIAEFAQGAEAVVG